MQTGSSFEPLKSSVHCQREELPVVADYELLRRIGSGAYGDVWLARSVLGAYRAVKVVYRGQFEDQRPFEREFKGIQNFEPVSRSHSSQVAVMHVGRTDDCFYYVMELADDLSAECGVRSVEGAQPAEFNDATSIPHSAFRTPHSAPIPHSIDPATYVPKNLEEPSREARTVVVR